MFNYVVLTVNKVSVVLRIGIGLVTDISIDSLLIAQPSIEQVTDYTVLTILFGSGLLYM